MRYITICSAIVATAILSSPVLAQQKTAKACEAEWRANKADYQSKKITLKAYVAECRAGGGAQAAPTAAPAASPKTTAAPATPSSPKSVPSPAAANAKPAGVSRGANQFATEAEAKARCPSDTVVYVNLSSKIYHFAGHKDYGSLKNGTYMCEKDTAGAGARAAKKEKHP